MRGMRALASGLVPLILVSLLAAAGAWYARTSLARAAKAQRQSELSRVAVTTARKGEFVVTVNTAGAIEAVKSEKIVAEVSGPISRVVSNGARVKKGDLIMELDLPRALKQLVTTQLDRDNAKADLESKRQDLDAEVKRAEASVAQAKEELAAFESSQKAELLEKRNQMNLDADKLQVNRNRLQRLERVADQGLIPKHEVDLQTVQNKADDSNVERQAKDLELAQAKQAAEEINKQALVRKAEADLARAKSKRDNEIASATAALQIQERELKRCREYLGKAVIRSPADGIIVLDEEWQGPGMAQRPLEPGDSVWEGRMVASVPDLSQMRVALNFPQEQARLVRKRQQAIIEVESIKGVIFPGEVTEISQTAKQDSVPGTDMPTGERTFAGYVLMKDTKHVYLRPGLTARVRVIIRRVKGAVIVPLECVFDRQGRKIVYVRRPSRGLQGAQFVPVEVELGVATEDETVVTKGLRGGEAIALRDIQSAGESPRARASRGSGPRPL